MSDRSKCADIYEELLAKANLRAETAERERDEARDRALEQEQTIKSYRVVLAAKDVELESLKRQIEADKLGLRSPS